MRAFLILVAMSVFAAGAICQDKIRSKDSIADELTDAARDGELGRVRSLLKSGIDIDAEPKGFTGWTALMAAATSGEVDVVKFLIDKGASTGVRLRDGETVLIQAAQSDDSREIVQILLKAGVDVNAQTKDGRTALMRFAWVGHRDAVKLLLNAGADPSIKDKKGWTAFYFACSHGNDHEIVKLLIDRGADVNQRRPDGSTPLMWLGWGNRAKNFQALIAAGADVNARDDEGTTALMISSSRLFLEEVDLLLRAHAEVSSKDKNEWTALMYVAASKFRKDEIGAHGDGRLVWLGATRVIEKLVLAGASLDEQNEDGDTALILSYKNGNAHFGEQLVKLGADTRLKNKKGLTALDYRNQSDKK